MADMEVDMVNVIFSYFHFVSVSEHSAPHKARDNIGGRHGGGHGGLHGGGHGGRNIFVFPFCQCL